MSFPRLYRTTFLILLETLLCFHVCSDKIVPRIIGGDVCTPVQYPFMVALLSPSECGGSLITLEWVLTAGHCLKSNTLVVASKVMVRSGFQAASNRIQIRKGKKVVVHKKFDYDKMERDKSPELRWDIALLQVDKPFKTSPTLNVVALPKPGFTKTCHVATVMGTGVEYIVPYVMGDTSRPLMCVDLNITNKTECKKTYPTSVVDDTIVCTLMKKKGKDACYGDSGGPLICRKTIIGIVSYGRGCGNAGLAATYTKVESYLKFIKESMKAKPRSNSDKESGSPIKESSWKLLWIIYLLVILFWPM